VKFWTIDNGWAGGSVIMAETALDAAILYVMGGSGSFYPFCGDNKEALDEANKIVHKFEEHDFSNSPVLTFYGDQ
jgi:hypothetical protein